MKNSTLSSLLNTLIGSDLSFSVYFLPGQRQLRFIAGDASFYDTFHACEDIRKGFVFAPYKPSTATPTYVINDEHYAIGETQVLKVLEDLYGFLPKGDRTKPDSVPSVSKSDFETVVKKAVAEIIRCKSFQKVVLSRPETIALADGFNPIEILYKLNEAMPQAFSYLTYIPAQGLWMGATPERLLEVEDAKAQTNALAGTLPQGTADKWSSKEIDEQQIVSKYIEERLKEVGIKAYDIDGPNEVTSGSVRHLRSVFSFDLEKDKPIFPVLTALHPTPAICGMPKDTAEAFLLNNENYPRDYYTGFLGPLGIDGESHIFVNLRCMRVIEDKAILYIGAGITEGSVAEKEWEETKVKALTLLNVIKK